MPSIFYKIVKCNVVHCEHLQTHTNTHVKLCLHSFIGSQPTARKTSANYSLRAAVAAQCQCCLLSACLEFVKFQVSVIKVFEFSICTTVIRQNLIYMHHKQIFSQHLGFHWVMYLHFCKKKYFTLIL